MSQQGSRDTYRHTDRTLLRPEAGAQSEFLSQQAGKLKEPQRYRYDSSMPPELRWDASEVRKVAETLIDRVLGADSLDVAQSAAQEQFEALTATSLDWSGKAENDTFEVESLPLFVHEKLCTPELLETLKEKRRDKQRTLDLFGEKGRSAEEKILGAYEHQEGWKNRLIFGDSLLVMNSLLRYESLGESVQMVYMDPPYGISFGGNFQPFVRKNQNVGDDDESVTREPEMIKAYRDTWRLGIHSWLTYMRNRLCLAHRLLADSGSCFVQISDENLHLTRCVLDEVFGPENFCRVITFRKTAGDTSHMVPNMGDYILWYAKEKERVKCHKIFVPKSIGSGTGGTYTFLESPDGKTSRRMSTSEIEDPTTIPKGWRAFAVDNLKRQNRSKTATFAYEFNGKVYHPGEAHQWKTNKSGLDKLRDAGWLFVARNTLRYKRYFDAFPVSELGNMWSDTGGERNKIYVVQTSRKVVQRCMLMTTDPGDLVLDPTCGSGTTAVVAEQWGRRWITCDTSRVPLALARQRLLTARFKYYTLKSVKSGPRGGFVYERKRDSSGVEVGGIVPHITLKSLVNDEPPPSEVIVDRPKEEPGVVRVCGPFDVESILPPTITPGNRGNSVGHTNVSKEHAKHVERMLEILRLSPRLQLPGNESVTLSDISPLAKSLVLHAEATLGPPPPPIRRGRGGSRYLSVPRTAQ